MDLPLKEPSGSACPTDSADSRRRRKRCPVSYRDVAAGGRWAPIDAQRDSGEVAWIYRSNDLNELAGSDLCGDILGS